MQSKKITFTAILLYPITLLYRIGVEVRNLFFDWGLLKSEEFPVPVISVGNITVGGTGKTPHTEYLANLLKDEYSVATLSRGYKRKTRHFIIADSSSGVRDIGDEPMQMKQKYNDLTVAVDRKRVNGINQLLKLGKKIEVILMDDAFQHRHVNPGKSILLMDYNRLITRDMMLPSGRLREPVRSKHRADIILITKSPEKVKPIELRSIVNELNIGLDQHLFFTRIEYGSIVPVWKESKPFSSDDFKNKYKHVLLVTGIANPRPLRKFARSIATSLHELNFQDHHAFSKKDLEKIRLKTEELGGDEVLVLTTEKDAMRFRDLEISEYLKEKLFFVPIFVKFIDKQEEEFNEIILNYVKSNRRDNILHKETD